MRVRFDPTTWRPLADLAAGLSSLVVLAGALLILVVRVTPPEHLPWTPLDLNAPVGRFTAAKLAALERDPERCRALLAQAGVGFDPAPDRRSGEFCIVEDAVRIRSGVTPLRPAGLTLRCPLAASLIVWDRQVLRPASQAAFGRAPAAIETYGSYACRRVYGSATGRPSEHARANALDVAGVILPGGARVTVAGDWTAPETQAEAVFLRRVRDGACGLFGAVLGPEYNRAHADHLHFDRGSFRVCR